jgi:hypothetical protein
MQIYSKNYGVDCTHHSTWYPYEDMQSAMILQTDRQMRSFDPTKLSNAGRPVCCLVSHVTNCLVNIKYDSHCQPVHSYCHYTTVSPQVFSLGGTAQDCQHNLYASKQNEPWIIHFWRNLLKGKWNQGMTYEPAIWRHTIWPSSQKNKTGNACTM